MQGWVMHWRQGFASTLASHLKLAKRELPTKKELAKSQFETNGGRDVAESAVIIDIGQGRR